MSTPYPWTAYFTDIGALVKARNLCEDLDDSLEAELVTLDGIFDDDADDLNFLARILAAMVSARASATGAGAAIVAKVEEYIEGVGRDKLEAAADSSVSDLLDDLIAKMADASQTVREIVVGVLPNGAEAGDASNQVSGYDAIRGLSSANVDASGILYVEIVSDGAGFYHIDLYNDAALGAGDLVAHTATYNSTGAKSLVADNSSGIGGSVTVDAVVGADSITVTYSIDGIRTGNGTLSAWAASEMALDGDAVVIRCTSAAVAGSEVWSVSSLKRGAASSTASTGSAYPGTSTDELGIEFTITAGGVDFAVGDEFIVSLASDDDGVFQAYFRDAHNVVLPSAVASAETIVDSLAT